MNNKSNCASCLVFNMNKVIKSNKNMKPTWLSEKDYVSEFINFNEHPDKAFSQWFLAYPKNHPFMKYTLDKVDNILGNKFKNKGGKKKCAENVRSLRIL